MTLLNLGEGLFRIGLHLLGTTAAAHTDGGRGGLVVLDGLATDGALAVLGSSKLLESSEDISVELILALTAAEFDFDLGSLAAGVDFLILDRTGGVDGITGEGTRETEDETAGDERQDFFHNDMVSGCRMIDGASPSACQATR